MNRKVSDCWVSFMQRQTQDPPRCFVTTNISTGSIRLHLISRVNINIPLLSNVKNSLVAAFVYIFTNIFYRLYRIAELYIYVTVINFRQKRRIWDNPAIVNQYFLCSVPPRVFRVIVRPPSPGALRLYKG